MKLSAHLHILAERFLKAALRQQDIVDFYLLSLVPENYLAKWDLGDGEIPALDYFKAIIQELKDEYIRRGMEELKDEARTTAWSHAISDHRMPDQIKPYYEFHESGYQPGSSGGHYHDEEDEDEAPYSCYSCGSGLYEDDTWTFDDETYCQSCFEDIIKKIQEDLTYCVDHHRWLISDEYSHVRGEVANNLDIKATELGDAEDHEGHNIVDFKMGEDIDAEYRRNQKKQLPLPFPREPKKNSSLRKKADGGAWWEAPTNFDGYTSYDYYLIFKYAPWKPQYGGPLWAEVARTVNLMQQTNDWQKLMTLIDHYHDLGHNTGKLLDKFPEWHQWLKKTLDAKASKDSFKFLFPRASRPVKQFVAEYMKTVSNIDWRKNPEEESNEEGFTRMPGEQAEYPGESAGEPLVPSPSSLVFNRLVKEAADKYPAQEQAVQFSYATPGTAAYEPYLGDSETMGAPETDLADALQYFIEKGGVTPIDVDLAEQTVKWSDGSETSIDELVKKFQESTTTKESSEYGFFDSPVDLGKHHDGDFPSNEWMPAGVEDLDADPNMSTYSSLHKAAEVEIDAVTDLMREHGLLRRIFLIFETELAKEDSKVDIEFVKKAAKIIQDFIQQYHEVMEEQYIFPKFKGNRLEELVNVLIQQHKGGREIISSVLSSTDISEIRESLTKLIKTVREHASREDTEVFPEFLKMVDPDEYKTMREEFEKTEHEKFGVNGFEDILSKVKSMEDKLGIYELKANKSKLVDYILKVAVEKILTLDEEQQIAAKFGPEYNTALIHLYGAMKNQHPFERAVDYAVNEMTLVGITIDREKLIEAAKLYLVTK